MNSKDMNTQSLDSMKNAFERVHGLIRTHLLITAVILIGIFVICELLRSIYGDIPIVVSSITLGEALITACFAACIVEWLTGQQMTFPYIVKTHQDVFFNSINSRDALNAVPKATLESAAVNAICVAYDVPEEQQGFVDSLVSEIGKRANDLVCEELSIVRYYTPEESSDDPLYFTVEESIYATINNLNKDFKTYRAWRTLRSGNIPGASDEVNNALQIERTVYKNGTEELPEFKIPRCSLDVDVEQKGTPDRKWSNKSEPLRIPPKTCYKVVIERKYCIPINETSSVFNWNTQSRAIDISLNFRNTNVRVTASLKSCTLCDKNEEVCYNCNHSRESLVRLNRETIKHQ